MYWCVFFGLFTLTVVGGARVKNDSDFPNFVFVLTDDQDLLLNGLMPMKKTLKFVADKGKFFQNAFANSPICCPSRSTILTGKYAHNTGVVNNSLSGNCAGEKWRQQQESETIAAILKKSGNYTNFYAGKYLNEYGFKNSGGLSHIPKGYDWWIGLKGNSKYYNYTLSVNGTSRAYRNVYLTDLLTNFSLNFLNEKTVRTSPFFMMIAPPASHAPFIPPKRYLNKFPTIKAVRNPSFNYTPADKHWLVNMSPRVLPKNVSILDQIHRRRLQTLLAVDDLVERVVLKLKELKIYQRTYFILSSDHGYHIGQFSQPWDKRQPYETDIRVPFLISGPNIPKKTLEPYPIASVDVAPTILDLAGIKVPPTMDGKSFKKHLFRTANKKNKKSNKMVFVEYWGEGDAKSVDKSCPWNYDAQDLAECSADQRCKCQDSRNNTYTCVVDFSSKDRMKFCQFSDTQLQVNLQASQPQQQSFDLNGTSSPLIEDDIDEALNNLQTTLEGSSISPHSNDITSVPELKDHLRFLKPKRFTLKAYKKYWFTCRDLHLYMYKTREDMVHNVNCVMNINLKGCEVTPDVNISQNKYVIKLEVPSAEGMTEMYIRCDDETQYSRWMACCRLAAKGRSLADSSYESEKQTILDFLNLQRRAEQPVINPASLDIQVEDYIAPKYLRKSKGKLTHRILEAHTNVKDLSLVDAKMNYIKAWQLLPEYGITLFCVKFMDSKKEELLGVGYNRIMKMDIHTGVHQKTWRFNTMKAWNVNWEIKHMMVQFEEENIVFSCLSADCKVVHEFIGGYIFLSTRSKDASQTLNEELFHKLTGGWS